MRHGANLPHIRFPALAEELRWRRKGRTSIVAGYVNPKEQRKRSLISLPFSRIARIVEQSTSYIYVSFGKRNLPQEAVGLTREVAA